MAAGRIRWPYKSARLHNFGTYFWLEAHMAAADGYRTDLPSGRRGELGSESTANQGWPETVQRADLHMDGGRLSHRTNTGNIGNIKQNMAGARAAATPRRARLVGGQGALWVIGMCGESAAQTNMGFAYVGLDPNSWKGMGSRVSSGREWAGG